MRRSKCSTTSGCDAARANAGCLFSTSYFGSGFASSTPPSSDDTAPSSVETKRPSDVENSWRPSSDSVAAHDDASASAGR